MSGEVENSKEEETKKEQQLQQRKSLKQRFHENWQIGIKILELLICATCLGIVYDPAKTIGLGTSDMHHVGIMYTAYTGFILINIVFLISRSMGDKIPYKTSSLFSISGAALFLITGILLIVDRSAKIRHYSFDSNMSLLQMLLVSAVFAFINVVCFAVDASFTFKRQEDF